MVWAARMAARFGPFGVARLAAAASLLIALGLVAVMLAAVFASLGLVAPSTAPANLGPWAKTAIPVRTPLPLSESPGLWLLRGDVALHNARVRGPVSTSVDSFDGPFSQPLHSVERITVTGARIWVNMGRAPRGASTAPDTAAVIHLIEPLQRLAFETLVLRGAHLTTQRVTGGQQRLEQLDAQIQAAPGRGLTRATGTFRHRDDTVSFDAVLQPVTTSAGRWSLPLRLEASGRHFQVIFNGTVKFDAAGMRCDGMLEVTSADLVALSEWLGLPLPARVAGGPMSLRGEATWRDGMLIFEQVQAELDGQVAQGAMSITLGSGRPFLDGALAFIKMDPAQGARWLGLGGAERSPKASGTAPVATPGPATPGPATTGSAARIPLFDAIDADLRVSADQLTGLGASAQRLAASLTARAGVIVADIADVDLDDGHGSGQIRIDQRGATTHYQVRGGVQDVDVAKLLALLPKSALQAVQGIATVRFEIAGSGRTFAELASGGQGEVHLSMGQGGRLPIDLSTLLTDARERKMFPFLALNRQESSFDRLDARFGLRQGTLLSEHMVVQKDGARVTADGAVLAGGGRIYLRLLTDHGQGLARTARLGRSQSVLIHGDIANPMVVLEEAATTQPPLATTAAPPAPQRKP